MAKCRACGANIVFIKMRTGKWMPCDERTVAYWEDPDGANTVITEKGEAVRCRLKGEPQRITGSGRISHFATCPAADSFRRR